MTFFRLIRIKQWVKNLFLFLPLIFSGNMLNGEATLLTLEAFLSFCLLSSSIYILNDIVDCESDRKHPVKCHRPIASGKIKSWTAIIISIIFCAAAFLLSFIFFPITPGEQLILFAYLVINILYTAGLKHLVIVDVMIIAAGFVLRVLAGGAAANIWVSPWLIMMVFLLTLLIAFGKRRDDLIKLESGIKTRKSVEQYNLVFIDQVLTLLSATMVVSYICYTLSPAVEERFNSQNVYLTSVFVIAATLRYLQIAMVKERSGKPTDIIYSDYFMQICGICWLLSFICIIYL